MPELPDVETVARRLRRALVGRKIRRVRVLSPSTVRSHSPDAFVRQFRERQVTDVQRRGKYLLISLDNDHVLVAHLRMTGDFEVHSADAPVHPHTRVAFVANGRQIRFVDQRRFGHIDLVRRPDLGQFPGLSALGIEPLSREFTVDRMEALFAHRRGASTRCPRDKSGGCSKKRGGSSRRRRDTSPGMDDRSARCSMCAQPVDTVPGADVR